MDILIPYEVNGEIIKSAIALKIRQNVTLQDNTSYKIYKERVVQGFTKPSFFIWTLDVDQQKQMRNNFERHYQMNVRVHLKDDATKVYEQLSEIGNKLLCVLSTIDVPILVDDTTLGKLPVIGTQMSFNIVDDVLQFFVTYKVRIKQKLAEHAKMQVLNIK